MSALKDFGDTAKGLARNPLGIIALFIVLIYGFASLVVGLSDKFIAGERMPLIWFLVIFPCLVLAVFAWLVSCHHEKLYAPSDYKKDEAFLKTVRSSYQAAISIGGATAKLLAEGASTEEVQRVTKEAADIIARVTFAVSEGQRRTRTVLWVDDCPNNNIFERQAMESFGFQFILSTSTEDALQKIEERPFDVIISDMGRPPDDRAGYTLLQTLRERGNKAPFFIYAGSRAASHVEEARKRGAQGTTNRPDELLQMVLGAVGMSVSKVPNT